MSSGTASNINCFTGVCVCVWMLMWMRVCVFGFAGV